MIYYKSECDKLIQFNPETNVYKIKNDIKLVDKRISKELFTSLEVKRIKKNKFNEYLNIYFKNIKDKWTHNGVKYKKLPNFEEGDFKSFFSSNYKLGVDVPFHNLKELPYYGNLVLVYHQGKVYYHTISYNGDRSGHLICPYTFQHVKWCRLKTCAPIFDIEDKRII